MIYEYIEKLLAGVAASVHPIVQANDVYEPTIGKMWIRATFMPGRSTTASLGINHYSEYQGLYRLDVFFDKGQPMEDANKIVDRLITQYKAVPILKDTGVIDMEGVVVYPGEVWREAARFEPVWVSIPVYVSWRSLYQHNNS